MKLIQACHFATTRDLAELYGTETKRTNEAVMRNKEKFPERYSFILTETEKNIIEVANCDLKSGRCSRTNLPRVFTEQGWPCYQQY